MQPSNDDLLQPQPADSEELVITPLNSLPIAIVHTTLSGEILSWNAAAGKLLKLDLEARRKNNLIHFVKDLGEVFITLEEKGCWSGQKECRPEKDMAFSAILQASMAVGGPTKENHAVFSITPLEGPRLSEKTVEDHEAKITSIYRAAPVGIGVIVNRVIHDVNDYFCQMVGFSKEQLIGRSARMFYLEEGPSDHLGSNLFPNFGNAITKSIETRFKRNDGSIIHVLLSVTPLFEHDRSKGITFTVTDITDRKHAEKQLRLSQETYAGIINSIREAIYVQDENGVFLDINDMAVKFYGFTKEEVIGKSPAMLSAPGKNNLEQINELVKGAYEGTSTIFEFWGKRRDGSIFPNEVSLSPGFYFGQRAVIAVARDITERKQSEITLKNSNSRLTKVMNAIDALIYVVDMNTYEILFLNDHGQNELGNVTGQICWQALQEGMEGPCSFCTNHLLINRDGTPSKPFQWEFQNSKTGRWYDCRDQAIAWIDGRLVRLEVAIDITARKQAEQALRFELGFKEMVADISSRFVNVTGENIATLVNYALKLSGEFFGVDRCFIFQFSPDGQFMDNTHEWCASGIEPQLDNLQELPVNIVPWWASKIRKQEHIHIPDVKALTGEALVEKEILLNQGIKSVLVIPMIIDGQAIGFYGFDSVKKSKVWSDDQISLIKVLTEIISGGFGKQQARQALMESEMQLSRAQKIGHIGSWTFDLGRKKLRSSDEAHHIFGLNPQISFTMDEVLQLILPHHREMAQQALDSAASPGWSFQHEMQIRRLKDDEIREVFVVAEFDTDRNAIFGMIQDVTERKKANEALAQSENLFRTLVENAFDGIYLMYDRRFVYINDRFSKIVGMTPEEITSEGFNFNQLLTERSIAAVEKRYADRKKGFALPSAYEMEIRTKTGELKEVEISTVSLEDSPNVRVLGVMRDITYRKHHQNLEQEVAVAKKSAQFKQNFLANMSHEIRTPITGIIGMAEILSRTSLSEEQREYLSTLKLSTENLREIINQILDYSKIEAGQMQIKNRVFSSRTLLLNARKVFYSICHKDIAFYSHIDERIPEFIDADEPRISQVINNFLSNAVKFTTSGEISVKVSLDSSKEDHLIQIRVEVSDTGPGIPESLQSRLFRPFAQLDQADQRMIEGTGLGLSISKELAHMMGGTIGVNSQPGEGSCFWFTFCARAMELQQEPDRVKGPGKGKLTGPLRILLVEDKVVNQKVITLMLNAMGHEVVTASNGQQALEKYVHGSFGLILMDIQMPVMDGITATHKLKEMYANLPPIVGLSANAFEGDREKYMTQGMDEYLTKPVQSEDFVRLLNRLFHK